ncbi:MAG: fibronectin type III domain-containing protein [Verrucomicrobiota bacterium]
MSKVKIGLDGLSVPDKIVYGDKLTEALRDNPAYPDGAPEVTALETATTTLRNQKTAADTARAAAKSATSLQDDAAAAFDVVVTNVAGYVQKASAGDKAKIESAGFGVCAPPAPPSILPAPTDVQAVASEFAGCADLSWQLDRDARLFLIERAEDAAELVFRQIATATKKSATVNSMVSRKKYWFRLAAAGPAGQSPWSEPVALFAP